MEMGFFDKTPTGEITSRLTADTAEMANDLTWVFRFTIEALVRIGGIMVYMFIRSWQLALLACSAIPITAIINRIYAKYVVAIFDLRSISFALTQRLSARVQVAG